jgi:hypothetical protein
MAYTFQRDLFLDPLFLFDDAIPQALETSGMHTTILKVATESLVPALLVFARLLDRLELSDPGAERREKERQHRGIILQCAPGGVGAANFRCPRIRVFDHFDDVRIAKPGHYRREAADKKDYKEGYVAVLPAVVGVERKETPDSKDDDHCEDNC